MGGNIPSENFMGVDFQGETHQGGIWLVGNFRVGIFRVGVFLIQARNSEFFGAEEVFGNKGTWKTFHVRHTKEEPYREKYWCFFSKILLKMHFKLEFNL